MAQNTQIEQTIKDQIDQLQKLGGQQFDQLCKEIWTAVSNLRAQSDDKTKKDNKNKNEKEDDKQQSEIALNPVIASKALNEHLETLQTIYQSKKNYQLGLIIVQMLLVFHQDNNLPEKLGSFVKNYEKVEEFLASFGNDFARNIAIYVAQFYSKNNDQTLKRFLTDSVAYLFKIDYVIEALDTVLEMHEINLLKPHLTKENVYKIAYYINQCVIYQIGEENQSRTTEAFFALLLEKHFFDLCCEIALSLSSQRHWDAIYAAISVSGTDADKIQFALLVGWALPGNEYFLQDQKMRYYAQGGDFGANFVKKAQQFDLLRPKHPDDVLKKSDIDIDWKTVSCYMGQWLMNGLVNYAYADDYLLNSHKKRQSRRAGTAVTPDTTQKSTKGEKSINKEEKQVENVNKAKESEKEAALASLVNPFEDAEPDTYEAAEAAELLYEGSGIFFSSGKKVETTSLEQSLATASTGLIWAGHGRKLGFEPIMRYLNSPDHFIRAGALMALGLCSRGAHSAPFDPIIRILAGQFNPFYDFLERKNQNSRFKDITGIKNQLYSSTPPEGVREASPVTNIYTQQYSACSLSGRKVGRLGRNTETQDYHNSKEALAALSIGISYAGTNDTIALDVLLTRLRLSSDRQQQNIPFLEKNPRGFAILAAGLVAVGSCDVEVADIMLRVMAGNSVTQRALRFFPLSCLGLGLIFLGAGRTKEGVEAAEKYSQSLLEKISAVQKPDSASERMLMKHEDNVQLAAYLQTLITIFAYAGSGDVGVVQDLMRALTDSIQGRVAAEECMRLQQFGGANSGQTMAGAAAGLFGTGGGSAASAEKPLSSYIASTGQPIIVQGKTLWPGENLDPATLLVLGLGAVAGSDAVLSDTLITFADKLLKVANLHAQRVVPLMLALSNLSTPRPELVDDLARLALHSDATLSYNAIIALGLVGAGTGNNRVAQALRHSVCARFFQASEASPLQPVVTGVQIAFGLLFAGKGAFCAAKFTKVQLAALLATVFFIAPTADVQQRTKIQPINFLFALILQEKLANAISGDKDNIGADIQFEARTGKAVEDVLGDNPMRLAGFSLSRSPIVVGAQDMAVLASGITSDGNQDTTIVPAWRWTNGLIVRPGTVVLVHDKKKQEEQQKAESKLKKDNIYE